MNTNDPAAGEASSPELDFIVANLERDHQENRPRRIAYFNATIRPTYIDNWPYQLHAMSVPSTPLFFPISATMEAIYGTTQPDFDAIKKSSIELERAIRNARIEGDKFFRLGSRSPKDWWYGHPAVGNDRGCRQPPMALARDIAASFLNSERVLDDCAMASEAGYEQQIYARAWVHGLEPFREFRCFMLERELAGISAYRAWEEEPRREITDKPKYWEALIRDWFPIFAEHSHLSNVVFDLVVLPDRVLLLEINPAGSTTYPAHFAGKPFDGRFRYLGDGDSKVVA